MVSNGKTLSDQGGPFTYAQGSVGEGPYSGGGSVSNGRSADGREIVDGSVAWTPSISDGVSGQVGESYTWTFPGN